MAGAPLAVERLHLPPSIDDADVTDAAVRRALAVVERLVHLEEM